VTTAGRPATGSSSAVAAGLAEARRRTRAATSDDWPNTSRLLPWGLAVFLAIVFIVPFDSVSLPVSLPLGAKLDRPLLMLLVAIWLLSLSQWTGVSRLRMSPVHWAFLVFFLVAVTSLVLDGSTIVMLNELDLAVRKLALLVSYVLLFAIVASSVKPTEVRNFTILMLGLGCVTAIGALIEYRTGFNMFYSGIETILPTQHPVELHAIDSIGRKSIVGPTVHPLAVAMMLSLLLPFALLGLHTSPDRRRRILYALAAGLMIAAAMATQRKTSVVAPAVGMLAVLAYRPRAALQLVPVALVMMVLIHLVAPGALGSVKDQLMPSNLFGVLSTKDRQSDYGAIKPDVAKHPVLGRGYESYDQKKYRILDNQYLSLIIGTGILGVLAYLSIFGAICFLAHRVARSDDPDHAPIAIAAIAAMASVVAGSALMDTLALPQLAYLICFIAGLVVVSAQAPLPRALSVRARMLRVRTAIGEPA
jgi:hypothetical protein